MVTHNLPYTTCSRASASPAGMGREWGPLGPCPSSRVACPDLCLWLTTLSPPHVCAVDRCVAEPAPHGWLFLDALPLPQMTHAQMNFRLSSQEWTLRPASAGKLATATLPSPYHHPTSQPPWHPPENPSLPQPHLVLGFEVVSHGSL